MERNPQILDDGVPALLWALLDVVVDTYLDALDALSDAVDSMEDDLFDDVARTYERPDRIADAIVRDPQGTGPAATCGSTDARSRLRPDEA